MSIYGSFNGNGGVLTESAINAINEETYYSKRVGLKTIKECRANADSVELYPSSNQSKYYLPTSTLERYMVESSIIDVEEAVENIAEANSISKYDIVAVYDECNEFVYESLQNSNITLEASVEDNAMSVKKIQKWYNKFITSSKSDAENKQQIKERIDVLKKCVSDMEKQMKNESVDSTGRIKYILKNMIPFNSIYRLIKRQDVYAGLGMVANMIIPGASYVVRGVTYKNMLKSMIDKTNEAIDFLEKKLKEMN